MTQTHENSCRQLFRHIQKMPIESVKAYFSSGEIESVANSEHRVYTHKDMQWQLACDLSCMDKHVKESDGKYFLL